MCNIQSINRRARRLVVLGVPIRLPVAMQLFPSFSDRFSQYLEHLFRRVPAYASICDAYTILQAIFAFLGYSLCAYGYVSQFESKLSLEPSNLH